MSARSAASASASTTDSADTTDQVSPPELELIDIPAALFQLGSDIPQAIERLGSVPAEVMNGIPEEVRNNTSNVREDFTFIGWKTAINHVDAWNVFSFTAGAFPTIEAVHAAGRLPDEDFECLTHARDLFMDADGNFSEPILIEVNLDVRRALGNVNRGIKGEEPVTREMVEQRRAERAEADAEKRRSAKKARQRPAQSAGNEQSPKDSLAQVQLRAFNAAWTAYDSNPTASNKRAAVDALRPFAVLTGFRLVPADRPRRSGS